MRLNATKKETVLLALFVLLVSFAACSNESSIETDYLSPFDKAGQMSFTSEFIPVIFDLDIFPDLGDDVYVYNSCITRDGVYLTTETHMQIGTDENVTIPEQSSSTPASPSSEVCPIYAYAPSLLYGSIDDGKCRLIDGYKSFDLGDGTEKSINSRSIYPGNENTLWIVTDVEYWDKGYITYLQQLDMFGNSLALINLNVLTGLTSDERICNAIVDPEGRLYVSTIDKVIVFDNNQKHLFTIKFNSQISPDNQLYLLADGNVAICIQKDRGGMDNILQTLDVEAQTWGTKYILPKSCTQIFSGHGEHLFFCNAGDSLLGYSKKTDAFNRLLSWTSVNINSSQILCLAALCENQLAVAISSDGGIQIASLKSVPSSELPKTESINYATLGIRDRERAEIIAFNQENPSLKIIVHDYSEYNMGENCSQGVDKLKSDLIAGKIDILDTTGQPLQRLGKRGFLEDLKPYLHDDPELDISNLMYHVLEVAMQNGRVYQIFPSFSIVTAAGYRDMVGNHISWTLEDFAEVHKAMPENYTVFGAGETKEKLFEKLFFANQSNFVDWNTGRCNFTCDKFKELLKFCNAISLTEDKEKSKCVYEAESGQLLIPVEIYSLDGREYQLYSGTSQFIGYPQQDGSVGSFFRTSNGMAITTSCKNKEIAWSFVRRLLLPGYTMGMFEHSWMPINRNDFEDHISNWSSPYHEENAVPFSNNQVIIRRSITNDEFAQLIELMDSIDTIYIFDKTIQSIVMEEADAYFNNDQTAEDVARVIQNRVSKYLLKIR